MKTHSSVIGMQLTNTANGFFELFSLDLSPHTHLCLMSLGKSPLIFSQSSSGSVSSSTGPGDKKHHAQNCWDIECVPNIINAQGSSVAASQPNVGCANLALIL